MNAELCEQCADAYCVACDGMTTCVDGTWHCREHAEDCRHCIDDRLADEQANLARDEARS